MRIFRRFVVVLLFVGGSGGCDNGATSGNTDKPAMPAVASDRFASTGKSRAEAPYGVVVDVSYPGDAAALAPDAKVYVFLRKAGERMPLALQYFVASDLPQRVSLAVAEPLSNVELITRLSFSGRVERSDEDVEVSQLLTSVGHPPETVVVRLQEGAATQSHSGSEQGRSAPAAPVDSSAGSAELQPERLSVRVRVTVEGVEGFPADSTVFVVARSQTNPMPLAVKKLVLADLPTEIELSDADAMMFSHRLSTADVFTLVARISRTGDAVRSAEDLESPAVAVDRAAIPSLVTLAISATE